MCCVVKDIFYHALRRVRQWSQFVLDSITSHQTLQIFLPSLSCLSCPNPPNALVGKSPVCPAPSLLLFVLSVCPAPNPPSPPVCADPACPRLFVIFVPLFSLLCLHQSLFSRVLLSMQYIVLHFQTRLFVLPQKLLSAHLRTVP